MNEKPCDTCCDLEVRIYLTTNVRRDFPAAERAEAEYVTHVIRAHRNLFTRAILYNAACREAICDRRVEYTQSAMQRRTAEVWTL